MPAPRRPVPEAGRALLEFLRTEAGGGAVLLVAALAALVWANSPWQDVYRDLQDTHQHWINDWLMTVFFFVVGLEIKRELVRGELQEWRAAALPAVAAVGGMMVPVVVFRLVAGSGLVSRGWGIPMATDIAFAVGVLAVLGRRVPRGLKVFVLTLAIVDDVGAIAVIAVFYQSGIQPTIAGVALGLLMPVSESLEARLHPWSSYVVIPLFALANAGVVLDRQGLSDAAGSRLTWAVVIGLVVGKLTGIAGATVLTTRTSLGRLPSGVGPRHVLGGAAVGGIGFTVSLFITGLAFADEALQAQAKIGILAGSLMAALLGAAILSRCGPAASQGGDL